MTDRAAWDEALARAENGNATQLRALFVATGGVVPAMAMDRFARILGQIRPKGGRPTQRAPNGFTAYNMKLAKAVLHCRALDMPRDEAIAATCPLFGASADSKAITPNALLQALEGDRKEVRAILQNILYCARQKCVSQRKSDTYKIFYKRGSA